MGALAIHDGSRSVTRAPGTLFTWPIVTREDEDAVLAVLRAGAMSGLDVTQRFEQELAAWHDLPFALCHGTGTAAIRTAMYGCRVGVGDEIICPSMTYWASAMPAFSLGATVVFADIDANTLCLDPNDIEARISERTKVIMAVHYSGHPCDMDPIMDIAARTGVRVIEDVSHAHGALYQGRLVGTIGHVAAMSMMSGKALACGEAGCLLTRDREVFERAVAFGHYARHGATQWGGNQDYLTLPELRRASGLPLGGTKDRLNQLSAAMGRVQLRHYPERMQEIQRAMNCFWDLLEGVPGLRAHRPAAESGSTMGGWYAARGLYRPEELGGLPLRRFAEAVRAEGAPCSAGANTPLHLHPVFNDVDVYGHGKPTRLAHACRDVRQGPGSLPVSEAVPERCFGIPWFKHCRRDDIQEYAAAYRKVAENADQVGPGDSGP